MGADLFEDKSAGALWSLDRLPADPLPPAAPHLPTPDPDLREVLPALVEHGHAGPERVLGPYRCALKALLSDWEWLRGFVPDPPATGEEPTETTDRRAELLPPITTEPELEHALKALHAGPREEGLPERAALACAYHGRHALAAVLDADTVHAPAAWLAEHRLDAARERVLIDVILAAQQVLATERVASRQVRSGSLPAIGPPVTLRRPQRTPPAQSFPNVSLHHPQSMRFARFLPVPVTHPRTSRRRPRVVHGESSLTLPISIRRVVLGERGFRVVSEVLLPKAENSRDYTGPSLPSDREGAGPGRPTGQGVPGQLATIRWEGFSRAEDDLGNRYLILYEVERGQPGLCRFLGTELLTQTLFPALAPGARRLLLTNPGHLVSHAPTLDGRVSGTPRTRTVPDGHVVTVQL